MFLAILFAAIVFMIILHEVFTRKTKRWKNLSMFPGNNPLPLFGNALELGFDADGASHKLMDMWRKHGKQNFRLAVGSEDWVLLSEADDVGIILSHPTELGKPLERNVAMMPFFGNSVSTSEGERWRLMRKLMTPSFQYRTLEKRVQNSNAYCKHLFNILDEKLEVGDIDLYRYLRPYMFDLLCSFRYAWVAMKATLSNIIRRYEILPGGPGSEPLFKYRIITESENGIHLKLKKRTY